LVEILEKLQYYLQFPFVIYAFIVGVLIALCSSLLGVTLVLKRFSYIGDGLSHVAFGAMAVASVIGLTDKMIIILPVTIITAIFLLKTGQNSSIKGDAVIAMLSVGALAIGYMLMNLFNTKGNVSGDVCTTLFGSTSILTLSKEEVIVCIVVTFDENFSKATGVKTDRYNLLIAVIIAVIIVLGMNLVGSLLISALIIFPALSAMRIIKNFKGVVIFSASLSVICAVIGMLVSILVSTPVGSTIVVADMAAFFICAVIGRVKG